MTNLPFDIDIAVQFDVWTEHFSELEMLAKTAITKILTELDNPKLGELSIALVSDADIQALNRDYRHKDKPTNVLSFPAAFVSGGPTPLLGDIVLAFETVMREATEKAISAEHHVTHLLIHGFLHLQGYDHETEAEAAKMEALEIAALAALNIDNPYEIHD